MIKGTCRKTVQRSDVNLSPNYFFFSRHYKHCTPKEKYLGGNAAGLLEEKESKNRKIRLFLMMVKSDMLN